MNEFEPFDYITRLETDWTLISQGQHVIPKCHKDIIIAAKKISNNLQTPYISVHVYASITHGVIIGELEPYSGLPYRGKKFRFRPHFDEELGMAWTQAINRLGRVRPVLDSDPLLLKKQLLLNRLI